MADKYELLAKVLEQKGELFYDQDTINWIGACIGVLRDLHDYEDGQVNAVETLDNIYSRIAHSEGVDFDEDPDELKPGQYDPVSGEYNPETQEAFDARHTAEQAHPVVPIKSPVAGIS